MNNDAMTARPRSHCSPWFSVPASVALLLAVSVWQLPGHTLLWRELQNTGHTLVFGVLGLLALCSYRAITTAGRHGPLHGYLVAGTVCLLGGIAVEIVQLVSGGDADVVDILRDLAGILIALGLCAGLDLRLVCPGQALRNSAPRILVVSLAAGLAVASAYPLASLARAYYHREQAFPVIVDLAAAWSRPFVQLNHASLDPAPGPSGCPAPAAGHMVSLQLEPVLYAGFAVIEPHPDWRVHDHLTLELFSVQSTPLKLTLRIHDARHNQDYADRFNRALTLSPGVNRIRVPLMEVRDAPADREMDMSSIAGVMLFAAHADHPVTFCTGVLRLE